MFTEHKVHKEWHIIIKNLWSVFHLPCIKTSHKLVMSQSRTKYLMAGCFGISPNFKFNASSCCLIIGGFLKRNVSHGLLMNMAHKLSNQSIT